MEELSTSLCSLKFKVGDTHYLFVHLRFYNLMSRPERSETFLIASFLLFMYIMRDLPQWWYLQSESQRLWNFSLQWRKPEDFCGSWWSSPCFVNMLNSFWHRLIYLFHSLFSHIILSAYWNGLLFYLLNVENVWEFSLAYCIYE